MNIRIFVAILSQNPQYDFPKMRGGGSKAVWNFSENSSVLETPSVPYEKVFKNNINIHHINIHINIHHMQVFNQVVF